MVVIHWNILSNYYTFYDTFTGLFDFLILRNKLSADKFLIFKCAVHNRSINDGKLKLLREYLDSKQRFLLNILAT